MRHLGNLRLGSLAGSYRLLCDLQNRLRSERVVKRLVGRQHDLFLGSKRVSIRGTLAKFLGKDQVVSPAKIGDELAYAGARAGMGEQARSRQRARGDAAGVLRLFRGDCPIDGGEFGGTSFSHHLVLRQREQPAHAHARIVLKRQLFGLGAC